jgi:succinate dehydrogenase/fumarate reductase cytochrome b subunit
MSRALSRRTDLFSGLSAGDQPSRLLRIYAALAGAVVAYPWLLAGFYLSGRKAVFGGPEAVFDWVGVAVFVTTVFAVPAFAFLVAIKNNGAPGKTASPEEIAARRAAHLAVAAPPLFTLTGVVLAIFNLPSLGILPWTLGWIAIFGTLASLHRNGAPTSFIAPAASPALRVAHGVSAALIILFYLALHLANHLVGLWTPDAHKAVMNVLRSWYRAPLVQPLLVLAVLFQVCSGLVLLRHRIISYTDSFGTLQTMAGAYLAAFLASHLTAVFILARWKGGIDTNWDWAVGNPAGLFADPWNVRLIPHYVIAVAAVVAHAACGLRVVLLANGVGEAHAGPLARGIVLVGALLALAIMAGMLGLHLGR